MPLSKRMVRIRETLRKRYGKTKGDRIFYAGKRTGVYKRKSR